MKFIKILKFFSLVFGLVFFLLASLVGCSVFQAAPEPLTSTYSDSFFLKGQALVYAGNFKDSISFLKKSLEKADKNYAETLMLLGRAYDQLDEPEQALLSLNEYISRIKQFEKNISFEIIVRSLIYKNQIKLNLNSDDNLQKPILEKILKYSANENTFLEKKLEWSLDFNCKLFCLEEIIYFRQAQLYLIYILEGPIDQSEYIHNKIILKYTFLKDSIALKANRKKLAMALFDNLQILKKYSILKDQNNKKMNHDKLLVALEPIEKQLESWTLE